MKNLSFVSGFLCALAVPLILTVSEPANPPVHHSVAFEYVSEGAAQNESVINNVQNLLKALGPQTQVILVAHGPGLALLTRSGTTEAERIRSLLGAKVVFAACRNTMRRKNVNPADLLEGVITVDSGVAEVVRRQHAGWAYINSGH